MHLSKISLALRQWGIGQAAFSPLSLFASGEQGAWYDPSDLSTMFQDSTGTTPVTAVGQPVGLILDKSKGLVPGPELVTNGNFTGVADGTVVTTLPGWSAYGSPTSRDIQGEQLRIVATGFGQGAVLTVSTVAGKWYRFTFVASGLISGSSGIYCPDAPGGTLLFNSGSLDAKIKASGTTMLFYFRTATDNAGTVYFDNISVKEIAGNHASQATAARRPVLQQDGNGKYYLGFDGVDDLLATAAIDFTATDKMSVFSGVRPAASPGTVVALGDRTVNSFESTYINVGQAIPLIGAVGNSAMISRFQSVFQINNTLVRTDAYDLAASGTTGLAIRINGAAVTTTQNDPGPSGGGNFANRVMTIGARPSDNFNGRIYSLIIRGAASTTQEITDTETWVAAKTGVTLP